MTERVALIVGAGDYIGAAIARRFAAGGFTVCLGRRNSDKLAPLVQEITASDGRAHGYALDARDEVSVAEVFEAVERDIWAKRGVDVDTMPADTLMDPALVAEAYWTLHAQSRDGWTHELDLRPYAETW